MKMFVVVGSQIPFDRMVSALDAWAEMHKDIDIVGQVGKTKTILRNIKSFEKLSAQEFNKQFEESDLIISHAGMGVILKALENGKPILVIPRQVALHECTTDHQLATARSFKKLDQIHVAMDTAEMILLLEDPLKIKPKHKISRQASDQLINTLVDFIEKVG